MENLVIVKQLPIIEEHLKELAVEVDAKVARAKALVCTEDTVKDVKNVRSELNAQYKELEESRKDVKKAVLSPYEQFEAIYKEYVGDKFKKADADLKAKIDEVENGLKTKKETEVKEYFNELLTANQIDFVTYGQARINVTLSASMKSLKEQAKEFVERIVSDLALIETQDHKAEILVEYRTSLNVSQAIQTVANRIKALEAEKERQQLRAQQAQQKEAEKPIEKAPLQAPKEVKEEPKMKMTFTVTGTMAELKAIKLFLDERNYQYE